MKAVVMAGGEGTRLRPLTCTRPKPMIRIMGKPVIGYIIDLLVKNGFDEIAVTSRYRSEDIEEYIADLEIDKTNIYCIEEENVLGTAGSVKNAAKNWEEPFLVISGDCICDAELSKIMLYHKSIMADVTIVCSTVEDPGEYGTVNLSRTGAVDSFCEKPDWSHASSNLANTGIYVINPAVLGFIQDNRSFDFASDLFPLLMNEGKRLYGYQTESYWCDIGDFLSLRMCIKDMMSHKVNISLPEKRNGIFAVCPVPKGDFEITPPVYFGKNVKIGSNCKIGPFTVLEDNTVIGDNTKIKRSVVLNNANIGIGCDITGAIVCENALLKRNTVSLEGSCIGDGCVVESGSTVVNNVLVWPEKHIPYRSVITSNLRNGQSEYSLISSDGISGMTFSEMSPERCCRLGEALGSSACGGKVAVGYDSTNASKALAMAVLSGLIASGSRIYDFGECFESQMGFFVSFCNLESGIFITADEHHTQIRLFGEYGLPLARKFERDIENRYKRSDFRRICGEKCNVINDMSSVAEIYNGQILSFAGGNMSGACGTIRSENQLITDIADRCFYFLGCSKKELPEFIVNYSGKKVSAKDENGTFVMYEKLFAICACEALKHCDNLSIPFDAPAFIDTIAQEKGKTVYRFGNSPMSAFDMNAGLGARKNMWAFDGLSLVFFVIRIMKHYNKSLHSLVNELPDFSVASKIIACNVPYSRLASLLGINVDNTTQGLRKSYGKGYVTVLGTSGGRHIRIIAESDSMEAATEMCIDTENKIADDTIDNMKQ